MKFDIRARRKELGLTLEAAGRKAGITSVGFRAIEVGDVRGKTATRLRIADALQVPVSRLISDREVKEAARIVEAGRKK